MTNGFNDDLSRELRKLNNNIESLSRDIRKNNVDIKNAFASSNQKYKEQGYGGIGVDRYFKDVRDELVKALQAERVGTYKNKGNGHNVGDVTQRTFDKASKELKALEDFAAECDEMVESMGHADLSFKDTVEYQKQFQEAVFKTLLTTFFSSLPLKLL